MKVTLTVAAIVSAAIGAAGSSAGTDRAFPPRIALPDGWQPEGIATAGERFYVGSIPTGAVYRGSLRTGRGAVIVRPQSGRAAIGLDVDRGKIFVAGGPTGKAFVYNASTGATLATYQLAAGGATFVNDVVVTRSAAWFTESMGAVLYRVPLSRDGRPGPQSGVRRVPLSGDFQLAAGFNTNGIDATANGATLVIVQSNTGRLFTVNPATGAAKAVDLAGESVPNGDGILLDRRTLYVVQNQLNRVAKITLSATLRSGRVVRRIANPGLDVPTTIDELGSRLYAVNARFGTAASATTDYWITQLRK